MGTSHLDLSVSVVDLAKSLCDIPSVSGDERSITDAIEQALRPCAHLTITRSGNALVAATSGGRATRVAIAGHTDTVPIRDNVPSWFEQRDGQRWLVGRGSVDMKSGVAVQLALAASLTHLPVDVTWIFYDNEEVSASLNGLGRLAREHPELVAADFAVLGEPTAAVIEGGCNGTCRFLVKTTGVRAHSARAWVGDNAIHHAAPVLDILAGYAPETIEVEGLAYREGLNAVRIGGGIAGNLIPDECWVEVNYRFAPNRSEQEVRDVVARLFGRWQVEFVDFAAGARPGLDAPLAQRFVAAAGGTAGPKYGWTDVARFAELGIPAVNFGPGDALKAHADDEALPVVQIEQCERVLRTWLENAG